MTVHPVTVQAFVEENEPILVVPASHWRLLCWLHAELSWKFSKHEHYVKSNGRTRMLRH